MNSQKIKILLLFELRPKYNTIIQINILNL